MPLAGLSPPADAGAIDRFLSFSPPNDFRLIAPANNPFCWNFLGLGGGALALLVPVVAVEGTVEAVDVPASGGGPAGGDPSGKACFSVTAL